MRRAKTIAATSIHRMDGSEIRIVTLLHVAFKGETAPLYSTSIAPLVGGNPDILTADNEPEARRHHAVYVDMALMLIGAGITI